MFTSNISDIEPLMIGSRIERLILAPDGFPRSFERGRPLFLWGSVDAAQCRRPSLSERVLSYLLSILASGLEDPSYRSTFLTSFLSNSSPGFPSASNIPTPSASSSQITFDPPKEHPFFIDIPQLDFS